MEPRLKHAAMSTEYVVEIVVDGKNRGAVVPSSYAQAASHVHPEDENGRPGLAHQDSIKSELRSVASTINSTVGSVNNFNSYYYYNYYISRRSCGKENLLARNNNPPCP